MSVVSLLPGAIETIGGAPAICVGDFGGIIRKAEIRCLAREVVDRFESGNAGADNN